MTSCHMFACSSLTGTVVFGVLVHCQQGKYSDLKGSTLPESQHRQVFGRAAIAKSTNSCKKNIWKNGHY